MVPWPTIVLDVSSVVVYTAVLPCFLALFYLLAWKESATFRVIPLTPSLFWVLLVGGFVGSIANIPFFFFHGSIMAVNVGGALVPVAIGLTLLVATVPKGSRTPIEVGLGLWVLGTVIATTLVAFRAPSPWIIIGYVLPLPAFLVFQDLHRPDARAMAVGLYGILAVVTIATFLTTQVIPSEGIVSVFPNYLLPPFLAAVLAISFQSLRKEGLAFALPLAYACATLGDLVGADIVHQPSLYAPGVPPILGAIGGAGYEDLVYLSGLIAIGITFGFVILLERMRGAHPPEPYGYRPGGIARAIDSFERLRYSEVASQSLVAVDARAARIRDHIGLPIGSPDIGVAGIPSNPLVAADYANLSVAAHRSAPERESAYRALTTGFYLLGALDLLLQRRLATIAQRVQAFLIDLVVTMVPAGLALLGVYRFWQLTGVSSALNSMDYEAALLAASSYPFVVFVVAEWWWGVTPGKRLLGLQVWNRDFTRPGLVESLGRNIPKLVTTTALVYGFGIAVPLFYAGWDSSTAGVAIFLGGIIVAAMAGAVAFVVVATNPFRRRVGDLLTGTLVGTGSPKPALSGPHPAPTPRSGTM